MLLSGTYGILLTLRNNKSAMSVHEIIEYMAKNDIYPETETITVYLSQMARAGDVKNDGKHECKTCGARRVKYRITEQGLIKVANQAAMGVSA